MERLARLRDAGALSEEEFAQAKGELLGTSGGRTETTHSSLGGVASSDASGNLNQWSMFIHLSQLASFIAPGAGFIAPIVLWQMKKSSVVVDAHGKMVVNWVLSSLLYGIVCIPLVFIAVGVFGLIALAICSVVFAIVGGIKAGDGEHWPYPLTIRFFK